MVIHCLQRTQRIPTDMATIWEFISSPKNLKLITPDYMGFDITSEAVSNTMYAGQIITYIVRPIMGIPLHWCTEITHVEEGRYFVDEQRNGPYAFWHHQHHIAAIEGGVEMLDIVHYAAPLGVLGDLFTPILIRPRLEEIFDYRFKKIEEMFGRIA